MRGPAELRHTVDHTGHRRPVAEWQDVRSTADAGDLAFRFVLSVLPIMAVGGAVAALIAVRALLRDFPCQEAAVALLRRGHLDLMADVFRQIGEGAGMLAVDARISIDGDAGGGCRPGLQHADGVRASVVRFEHTPKPDGVSTIRSPL